MGGAGGVAEAGGVINVAAATAVLQSFRTHFAAGAERFGKEKSTGIPVLLCVDASVSVLGAASNRRQRIKPLFRLRYRNDRPTTELAGN